MAARKRTIERAPDQAERERERRFDDADDERGGDRQQEKVPGE